jgi:hypothetical protein
MTRTILIALSTLLAQSVPADRAADAAKIRAEIERIRQAFVDRASRHARRDARTATGALTPLGDHVIRGIDGYVGEGHVPPATPKGQGMVGYRLSDFRRRLYGRRHGRRAPVLDTDVAYAAGRASGSSRSSTSSM